MDIMRTSFHVVCLVVYVFGIYFDLLHVVIPPDSPMEVLTHKVIGGRWKFLTFIDLILQCAFFGLSVLNDLLGSNTTNFSQRSILQRLRDFLFSTLVFPLGLFVPLVFWGLYAVDRHLIFPPSMDAWFPGWLNHVMHTLPIVAALLELITTNHIYPKGFTLYFPIVIASALYLSGICYIAHVSGMWVYGVFEVLSFNLRVVFMVCLLLPIVFFVFLGNMLHTAFWGSPKVQHSRRKGKKDKSH